MLRGIDWGTFDTGAETDCLLQPVVISKSSTKVSLRAGINGYSTLNSEMEALLAGAPIHSADRSTQLEVLIGTEGCVGGISALGD